MKHRLKVKKQVWIILIILLILGITGVFGYKKYQEYLYQQTYEYKLLQKGYSLTEVNFLEENFSKERLNYFLKIDKDPRIISFKTGIYWRNWKHDRCTLCGAFRRMWL